ncbi:hypothetical protein V4C53_40295 [Paraburkholderia azotifigens]|uniref:hypothetical protein n=1 Tax=Paraburkholderia azotifigens TaxID=2057004 RepID=UPI00317BE227
MNKTAFTIVEIEQARPLADVHGLMIFRRANSIEASKLNDDLLDAIRGALHQQDLPP